MKPTIASISSVIENSITGSSGLYDKDLLKATLAEAIPLHLDGKHNEKGHQLSDLSSRLVHSSWPCAMPTKARAALVYIKINEILDLIDKA